MATITGLKKKYNRMLIRHRILEEAIKNNSVSEILMGKLKRERFTIQRKIMEFEAKYMKPKIDDKQEVHNG